MDRRSARPCPVTLDVSGRDLAPRQPGELGMQAWSHSVVTAAGR
jgi:hypothetical protein